MIRRIVILFLALAGAIRLSAASQVEKYAPLGQLIITPFQSAPFPHPLREQGHQQGTNFFPAAENYHDSTVVLFVPRGFHPGRKVDFVVHFHGWSNTATNALERYHLIDQFAASGRNAILIVPQGPFNARDSFDGKLEDPDGFKRFMDEAMATLRERGVLKKEGIGNIILSGHSGGYEAISSIVAWGGLSDHVREVWLFDALYANTERFVVWFDHHKGRFIDIYTEHGGTEDETRHLMAALKGNGVPFYQADETNVANAMLRKSHLNFFYTELPHDETVQAHRTFQRFLETSFLGGARHEAATPTFDTNDPYFAGIVPTPGPVTKSPALLPGSRLAICGDSITEQRLYSRMMETYITVALPELGVSIRQFGWSGEQASGFLRRMTNDVLRFKPTVATTCYGMNDHRYRPYEPSIGQVYESNTLGIVDAFQAAGTTVVLGSSGCMGWNPGKWSFLIGTPHDQNFSLCKLRNIDVDIARSKHTDFADVFWPMFTAQFDAVQQWGTNYALAGKDSVHPGQAGHLVMAYAFLKALDVPGEIGTIKVDLKRNTAKVSEGHRLISCQDGVVTIQSFRYPFCADGSITNDNSIRSGMALVPFNQELNRFILMAKNGAAQRYKVTWGDASHDYTAEQLAHGINLAADFPVNPFSDAFKRVDEAVAKKQEYETKQIKSLFHGPAGKADMEKTVQDSEKERAALVADIQAAFVPVAHTIHITPE